MTVLDGDRLTFRKWVRQLALPVAIVVAVLLVAAALSSWLGLG